MSEKIAIYGGAFNPPTFGHFHVIKEVFKNSSIEKIIITPDGFRDDKNYKIEKKHRKNLIKIFIVFLQKKGFNIEFCDYFFENKNLKETKTKDVDEFFIKKLNKIPFHIFGTDISGEIKNWSGNPNQYIEKKLKKIFIKRKGFDFINKNFGNYIIINPLKQSSISSTKVRENIKNKKDFKEFVPNEIYNYIKNNKLYI